MAPDAAGSLMPSEQSRDYLLLLARMHIDPRLRGKVDASDIVQQTRLRAHDKQEQFKEEPTRRGPSGSGQSWLPHSPTRRAGTARPLSNANDR
jgi:hypothetical protein